MNEVKIAGRACNITSTGIESTAFDLKSEEFSIPCIIEGVKSTVFYNLLIEGDPVYITGKIIWHHDKLGIRILSLQLSMKTQEIHYTEGGR